MKKEAVTRPSQQDRCDWCGNGIGSPSRTEYRYSDDGWRTVGCSADHARDAARLRVR